MILQEKKEPNLYGLDLFGDEIKRVTSGPLSEKFLIPPFSILDAKQGDWQERKRTRMFWCFAMVTGAKQQKNAMCKQTFFIRKTTRQTASQSNHAHTQFICA